MDKHVQALIDRTQKQGLAGVVPDRETIVSLLEIKADTEEMDYLVHAAGKTAEIVTSQKAYLWGAIGIDFAACPMNCAFCSFGEKWGIVKEELSLSEGEILAEVRNYADAGVYYIVLRTTEFYDLNKLAKLTARIRREVPGTYELILNVGEFDLPMANKLYRFGVDGIYHAVRLREGIDTAFDPRDRMKTLSAIAKSPLKLTHLIEPLGPEHTNEEIAEQFLRAIDYGVFISGVMARVPVKGTPLGDTKQLGADRIAHVVAVLRLAGGYTVPNICVHPASPKAIAAGANVTVIEKGAIPRDDKPATELWHHFTADLAKRLFDEAGYQVCPENGGCCGDPWEEVVSPCPWKGAALDRFVQPAILSLLLDECLTAYQIRQRLLDYSMYRDRPPDMTGIYRYAKAMESQGFLEKKDASGVSAKKRTLYSITPAGRKCLRLWLETMERYETSIHALLQEMGGF